MWAFCASPHRPPPPVFTASAFWKVLLRLLAFSIYFPRARKAVLTLEKHKEL